VSAAREVHAALLRRAETVAVAESLTGGLVAAALTDVAGASATFRGGLVVYATDLKTALAGVPASMIDAHGPVHTDVAAALASGARRVCGADWGIGLTGVAGPEPQGGREVGTLEIGLSSARGTTSQSMRLAGDRSQIRAGAVAAALSALLGRLVGAEEGN